MSKISRRQFLRGAAGVLGLVALGGPVYLLRNRLTENVLAGNAGNGHVLVVVELYGGNDGLNTVIPYQDPAYYQKRPNIAVPKQAVLPLDGQVGLHPSLKPFQNWYGKKQLAVIQGVGYPNPNLSHFRSMDIWWSADPGPERSTGWLGRYLDATLSQSGNPLRAVNIGSQLPKALVGRHASVASLESLDSVRFTLPPYEGPAAPWLKTFQQFNSIQTSQESNLALVQQSNNTALSMAHTLERINPNNYHSTVTYPKGPLATSLQLIALLIAANLGTEIFYVGLSSFDFHSGEKVPQGTLLNQYAQSMDAFFRDLEQQGKADKVAALTYSEFGRRVVENASGGTDHGTASVALVMGAGIKGGMYGEYPSLENLDHVGNLKYNTDFRAVYSTLLEGWLDTDPTPAIGKRWPAIGFA